MDSKTYSGKETAVAEQELGKGIRRRVWRRKSSRKQKEEQNELTKSLRCSHNIYSCCQHSQAFFPTLSAFLPTLAGTFPAFFTPLDGSDLSNLSHLICFCAALTGMYSTQPPYLLHTGNYKPACGLMLQIWDCCKVEKCIIHSRDTYSILLQYLKHYSYLRILCCLYCNQK